MIDPAREFCGLAQLLQVCNCTCYDDFIEIKPGAVAEIQTSLSVAYQGRIKDMSDQPTSAKSILRHVILFAGLGYFAYVVSYALTRLQFSGEPFFNPNLVGLITGMTYACILGGSSRLLRQTANLSQPTRPGVSTGKHLLILSSKMRETQY